MQQPSLINNFQQLSPRSDSMNDFSRTESNEQPANPFVSLVSHNDFMDYKRVESKDN